MDATANPSRAIQKHRVASVSFLNSKPLIHGLDEDPAIDLTTAVPSALLELLRSGRADVALLPVIDYQRLENLKIVPSSGIGSEAETLTVRLFARRKIETVRTLACDPDSHTSVALARIILAERYGVRPELIDLRRATNREDEARLLIGDKVICEAPDGFAHQYDLGMEWRRLTGLPFVFAVWTARANADLGDLPRRLERAKIRGMEHVREIVDRFAIPLGWPAPLALQYLTCNLHYEIGPDQIRAIERFHALCVRHGMLPHARPLQLHNPAGLSPAKPFASDVR